VTQQRTVTRCPHAGQLAAYGLAERSGRLRRYRHRMASALEIYLRNHEAAGQAGRDLFRRVAENQRSRPYAAELATLASDVDEDLRRLRALMSRAGISIDLILGVAMRAGERLARFKPNGRILSRAPLSDLIEIEGLLDAVRAKWAGWHALSAIEPDLLQQQRIGLAEIDELRRRAEAQVEILIRLHAEVAARLLAPAST
jgi:hypothetical protein